MTTHDLQRQNPEREHDGPLADDLVQLYQQAVGLEDARPSEQLRATVLAAALQKAQPVQRAGESASAGVAPSVQEGIAQARQSIDSGSALAKLQALVAFSQAAA